MNKYLLQSPLSKVSRLLGRFFFPLPAEIIFEVAEMVFWSVEMAFEAAEMVFEVAEFAFEDTEMISAVAGMD